MAKDTRKKMGVVSEAARLLGMIRTPKKAEAARRNAKKRWDDYRAKKKKVIDQKKGRE